MDMTEGKLEPFDELFYLNIDSQTLELKEIYWFRKEDLKFENGRARFTCKNKLLYRKSEGII